MSNIRIKDIATTAASTASDDFIAIDGATNGTRKLDIYNPTIGGNATISGGTITGGATGLSLASGGTNQNITLTPSGNGVISNGAQLGLNKPIAQLSQNITASGVPQATYPGFIQISGNGNGDLVNYCGGIEFLTAGAGNGYGVKFGAANNAGANLLQILSRQSSATWTEWARWVGSNLLLGTATDSSNGKLQLATHTTSAGGIGFGTDISLYRGSSTDLYTTALKIASTTAGNFYLGTQTSSQLILQTNNTNAVIFDTSQNATFAGKITANGAGSTFKGTTTNDSAAAGYFGEYVSSTLAFASRASNTNGTYLNVTSISLTAGDWDVTGSVSFYGGSATISSLESAVSQTSGGVDNDYDMGQIETSLSSKTGKCGTLPASTRRISLASTTTIYLVSRVYFSAGTAASWGTILARRIR